MNDTLRSLLAEALEIIGNDYPMNIQREGGETLRPSDDQLPSRHLNFVIRARRALSENR